MARLPGSEALGERPVPVLPRRTPMVATYRATSGFEDAAGQELMRAGNEFEQAAHIALQAKEQHDALRAEDAATKLRQKQIDMTFGKDGFVNLKGGDAVNRPLLKDFGGAFDQSAAALAGTLDNDYQRQLFQRRAQISGMQMREDIVKHVAHQSDVYAQTAFKSKLDVESRMAGLRWSQPDGDVLPILNLTQTIEGEARRQGLQGEVKDAWVSNAVMAAKSKVYTEMVKAALVSDPLKGPFAAEAMLALHGKDIDPGVRLVLTHEVKSAIQPIEVAHDAERSVKDVLIGVATTLAIGGPNAANKTVAAESGPATFRFRNKKGEIEEGTAANERSAQLYGAAVLGLEPPAKEDVAAATKRSVQALLGEAIAKGEAYAQQRKPGDLQYRDRVIQSIKGYVGTIIAAHDGVQKGHIDTLIRALNPLEGAPPITREQLLGNPANRAAYLALDPLEQLGIDGHLHQNLVRAQGGATKQNLNSVFALSNRIFMPADDPSRVRTIQQLIPYLDPNNPDHINVANFNFLAGLIDKSQSVAGLKFAAAVNRAAQSAKSTLLHSMIGQVDQDGALNAANQYHIELQAKVEQYIEEGKDPRSLLQPGTKDSMVDPAVVMGYLGQTPRGAVAAQAGRLVTENPALAVEGRIGGGPVRPVGPQPLKSPGTMDNPIIVKTEAEKNALVKGIYYRGPDGKLRQRQ